MPSKNISWNSWWYCTSQDHMYLSCVYEQKDLILHDYFLQDFYRWSMFSHLSVVIFTQLYSPLASVSLWLHLFFCWKIFPVLWVFLAMLSSLFFIYYKDRHFNLVNWDLITHTIANQNTYINLSVKIILSSNYNSNF